MSATPRLFVKAALAEGGVLELDEAQAHYLTRVMRLRSGDPVRLFNGRDGEHAGTVGVIEKRAVSLDVGPNTRKQVACPDLWVLFAPIKRGLSELIVEKAVELGVRRMAAVRTVRTNGPALRADRVERIIIEAAEQTERLDVPELGEEVGLEELLASWPRERALIFCDEAGEDAAAPWGGRVGCAAPAAEVLSALGEGPAGILVGPEGGFSAEERSLLRSKAFVRPISLGPRILRAETAAIAVLSVWQALCGDWRAETAPEN